MNKRSAAQVLTASFLALAMAQGCEGPTAPEKPRLEEDVENRKKDTRKDVGRVAPMDVTPDAEGKIPVKPIDPEVPQAQGLNYLVFADEPAPLIKDILEQPQNPTAPNSEPQEKPPIVQSPEEQAAKLASGVSKKTKDIIENLPKPKFSEKLTLEQARQRLEAIKLALDGKEFEDGKYRYDITKDVVSLAEGNGVKLIKYVHQQDYPEKYKKEQKPKGVLKVYIAITENPDGTWSNKLIINFPNFSTTSYTSRFIEITDQPITQELVEEKVEEALESLPEIRYSTDQLDEFTEQGVSVVMFKPTWRCGGCKRVAPGIIEAAKKAQCNEEDLKFARFVVASEDEEAVRDKLDLDSFPTIIIYKDGVAMAKFEGPVQNGINAFQKPHEFGDWLVAEANKIKEAVQIAEIQEIKNQLERLEKNLKDEVLKINNVEYVFSVHMQEFSYKETGPDGILKDIPEKREFKPIIKLFRKGAMVNGVSSEPAVLTFEIEIFQTDPTYWSNAVFIKDKDGEILEGLSNEDINSRTIVNWSNARLSN